MSYLTATTRSRGYEMNNGRPTPYAHQPSHFITAEHYLRTLPLASSLADAAVWHAEVESKRTVKSLGEMLGTYKSRRRT